MFFKASLHQIRLLMKHIYAWEKGVRAAIGTPRVFVMSLYSANFKVYWTNGDDLYNLA